MSTLSGCKLFGAYRAAISIKDSAILVHSTIGCNWGTLAFHSPSRLEDIRQASSVVYEKDIVYGGTANLLEALKNMVNLYDCSAIFVLTGCVTEIMEADTEVVVNSFKTDKPIIAAKAAGFRGDMISGTIDVLKLLIDNMEVKEKMENSINIIGVFSDDFRVDADLLSIKALLSQKVKINSIIPYDTYDKILEAPKASLNVVFEGFETIGIYMEQKFGIPFVVVDYPYGILGNENFLSKIAKALNLNWQSFILNQQKITMKKLESIYGHLHKLYGMPVAVRGDDFRAPALRNFLEKELGMNAEVFFCDSINGDEEDFSKAVEASNAVMVFGSSYERGVTDRLGIPLIRYSYPVFDSVSIGNFSYSGFEGTINLIEDIINAAMTVNFRRDGMFG